MKFKIAVAQIVGSEVPSAQNIRANAQAIRDKMGQAHKSGARLVQFHEGSLSSYPSKRFMSSTGEEVIGEADWSKVAWDVLHKEIEAIRTLARELKIWVVLGSVHRTAEDTRPFNSLYVISDKGVVSSRYDKRLISHTEVSYLYKPGYEPVTFEIDGWKFGCAVCIEINFPEVFMEYEALDVDCVLFSTYSEDTMFGVEAQGHAAGNSYWISYSTPTQGAKAVGAGVIAPNGEWIDQANSDDAQTVIVTLDSDDPRAEVAVKYRRPWRKAAREGGIYRRVTGGVNNV